MKNKFFFKFLILILPFSVGFTWNGDFYISSSGNSWPDLNASIGSGWKFGGSGDNSANGSASKVLTLTCVSSPSAEGEIAGGTFYFRIIHKEGSDWHSWGGSGSDVSLNLDSPSETITHDNSWSTNGSKTFTATVGKTYKILFQANPGGSGGTSYIGVYEFSGATQSISSVSNLGNGLSSSAYTVTTTLGGTPVSEERVYVRYSTDNWSSSSLVEGNPGSNSIDIDIPSQSAGATVKYYVFTGVTGISAANADKATILLSNNSGNNYSYYVESGTATISGNSGYRMLSSPVSGQILGSLLNNLWTQGMTGADVSGGNVNVWTLNVAGQSWTALSDISNSGTSLDAGQGFLVYVFEDTDYDGSADLPVTLSVSGTENSGSVDYPASGSIDANEFGLAGNPYYSTIDWDDVTKTNINSTVSVWDDAAGSYKSWNGSAGGLTNGLIAPFQGFWVQANSSGSGSITIEAADKASSAGILYRVSDVQESGSVVFDVSSSEFSDQTFMSFQSEGEAGLDNADGYKLFPLNHSDRLVAISYADDTGLDINNLPYDNQGDILIPFDIMKLQLDGESYVTQEEEITFTWDVSNLPEHISITLIDQVTAIETDINLVSSITLTTQPKGSFSTSYSGPIGTYPVVEQARFSLAVHYDALASGGTIKTLPAEVALHAAYPNPFNPTTAISFDLSENGKVLLNAYNLKGALVGTLLNENKVAGTYQYRWTPNSKLSSGMYIFELKTKSKTIHQKITYIK